MSSYYFAYGSNMNQERMTQRGLEFHRALPGRVENLKLAFNKRAADAPHRSYANVIYQPGHVVEGVLYELVSPREIVKMDPFEGAPRLYSREIYGIETDEGMIPSWVYIANKAMITEGLLPARWYLNHLLAGREFLSDDYYQALHQTPCLEHEV